MSTDTNFNVAPYFDDFDPAKDFYRILFRPGVAVQARELTQLQTIMQQQVERFGNQILKDGTIVTGCTFNFDPNYTYVKLPDLQVDGQPVSVAVYGNTYIRNSANLTALVVGGTDGLESQTPDLNTVYVKYLNSGTSGEKTFVNDEVLTVYPRYANGAINVANTVAQVKVANSTYASAVGTGFAFSVADGILYQKGFFSRVEAQTTIVSKYTTAPDSVVVGFRTVESIVDSNEDTSLLDNAQGFTNENAPGANRLRLTPTLSVFAVDAQPNNFFSVVEFQQGNPVKQRQYAEYAGLGRELAARTYDESGNYVVKPFNLSSTAISGNTTHLNVSVSAGKAYVEGYAATQFNTAYIPIEKGTDVKAKTSQVVSINYGNYVRVNEVLGSLNFNQAVIISLRDTAAQRLTNGVFTPAAPGVEIGTAKVRSFVYETGNPGTPGGIYRAYVFDVKMAAGKNFKDVRSIYRDSTNDINADIVLEGGNAFLYETDFSRLVFPVGSNALKTLRTLANDNQCQFTYRTAKTDGSFNTSGQLTITLSGGDLHPYTPSSTLNDTQELDVTVIPLASANGANTSGTVTINATASVVGTSTSFLSEYSAGQWIFVNGQARDIDNIANNTFLTVTSAFANSASGINIRRHFPANVPVKMSGTAGGSISIDGSGAAMTISLGTTINASTAAVIYYNIEHPQAVQLNKTVSKGIRVKVDLSSHASGIAGPWSLGVPDAWNLQKVYKATTFTNIETVGTDVTTQFLLDAGQSDNAYGLSALKKKPGSALTLTTSDKLIAIFDVFVQDASGGGKGFYSVDSYPIDDATVPLPVDKIRTQNIPVYSNIDLRNAVDFRPVAANTAAYANTAGGATTNPASTVTYSASEKYFPVPNDTFSTALQYYLARIDRVALDASGSLKIIEGVSSESPATPPEMVNGMTLGVVTIPPYPSLDIASAMAANRTDYAVRFVLDQTKRYTMENIGALDQRITSLEYYTSLSLLEKKTSDLVIPSDSDPTLNRFKNGIFVDPFTDFSLSTIDGSFSASIDPAIGLQPKFKQTRINLLVASATGAIVQVGDMVTASYTDKVLFTQPYGTKYRNAVDQLYNYVGKMTLLPNYDSYFDTTTPPQVVTNDPGIDNSTGHQTTPINTPPPPPPAPPASTTRGTPSGVGSTAVNLIFGIVGRAFRTVQ